MLRYFRVRLALSLVLAVLMCGIVSAGSGDDHMRLWRNVFGVRDKTSRENIQPLWRTAQEVIDRYEEDYDELKKNFPWFKRGLGTYSHRLLFHWGFNADPKRYPPLVRQVRLCLKDHPDAKNEERKFLSYLTNDIQSRRNRKLINAVVSVTGIPTARGYASAIATIIYDVHLLLDYEDKKISALPKIDDIEKDLMMYGFNRLITGGDKSERLKRIEADLRASINAGRGRVNSYRARSLNEAVGKYLPQILNERFKNTLGKKGITITE